MARSRPAAKAPARKVPLTRGLNGRPKLMLETPSTHRTPGSSRLTAEMASRMARGAVWSVEAAMHRQSMTTSWRGMPMASVAATIFLATARRPSAVGGMPSSSSVRPTMAQP